MSRKKKKKGSSYGGPAGGPHGGWKSKPTKTKSTRASLPPSMGFQPSGGGVDRGLAAAVANQASRDASIAKDRATGKFSSSPPSRSSSGITNISYGEGGVDPKLAAAAGLKQGDPWVSTSGWTADDYKIDEQTGKFSGSPPDDKNGDGKNGDGKNGDGKNGDDDKKDNQSFDNSQDMAEWVVNWWKERSEDKDYKGYRKYGDRTNLFTGNNWNTSDKIIAKLADKFNKGYYSLTTGPNGEPLIVHSTGTMVNPFTGSIISTQTQGDQGGAYQNRFADSIGVDKEYAGVFSKEYQRGNGLAVSNMKPQHALRHLINKNPKALEQFYQMNKNKKGFNPFSVSSAGAVMSLLMNSVGGPVALQVGNNLERAGWGKAIKGDDGKYTVKLTEDGAKGWQQSLDYNSSPTFKGHDGKEKTFYNFISPEAIEKDQNKGWLSDLLGTKKFQDVPIDLTNLIGQGGYFQSNEFMGLPPGTVMTPQEEAQLGGSSTMMMPNKNFGSLDPYLNPDVPFKPQYGFMPQFTPDYSKIPGSVSDDWREGGSLTNYPQFTPEGYKIGAYNPSRTYGNQGGGGQGGGGGGTTPDPSDPTNPYGNLTFDVYGRPVTYDYTGGQEQLYLGGGWKRDGQYIGSPWGFKNGGIANFKPYGY